VIWEQRPRDRPALSESLRTVRNVGRIVWMVVLIRSSEAGSDGLASRGRSVPPGIRARPENVVVRGFNGKQSDCVALRQGRPRSYRAANTFPVTLIWTDRSTAARCSTRCVRSLCKLLHERGDVPLVGITEPEPEFSSVVSPDGEHGAALLRFEREVDTGGSTSSTHHAQSSVSTGRPVGLPSRPVWSSESAPSGMSVSRQVPSG
jgi:hypothetical protein